MKVKVQYFEYKEYAHTLYLYKTTYLVILHLMV